MNSYEITVAAFDKMAEAYQDKFMHLDLYNDTYDIFCAQIQKLNAAILEIGCGPGNISKYILEQRPDFRLFGIDMAPNMVKLAQANIPGGQFSVMDAREIDKLPTKFDGIICGFCMPYLSREDCAKLIKDAAGLLNPDGILYFSTIEGDYNKSGYEKSSNGQDQAYVYYHQEDYLQEYLQEKSFQIINLIRKSYIKPDGTESSHMIFIGQKS